MKNSFIGMMIALVLSLALVIGAAALAESIEAEQPAVEQTQPEQAQPEQAPAEAEAPSEDAAADATALQEAIQAYREAKVSSAQEDLEAELKGYVESGKLTQEQADLILNYCKEREAMREGKCPNCGYQLQNNQGKCNRASGGFGGQGGRGMRMGQNAPQNMPGAMGQQPSEGQNGAPTMPGEQSN